MPSSFIVFMKPSMKTCMSSGVGFGGITGIGAMIVMITFVIKVNGVSVMITIANSGFRWFFVNDKA